MKLLSRPEEIFLVAIWKLQGNAYAVSIRDELKKLTGKTWSFGAVFITLERLANKKYLQTEISPPTKKRGGRSKRLYFLTRDGKKALIEIRNLQESIWSDVPELTTRSPR